MSRARRSNRLALFAVGLVLFTAGAAVATLINGPIRRSKTGRCRRRWPAARAGRWHPDSVSTRGRHPARGGAAPSPLRRHRGGGRFPRPFSLSFYSAKHPCAGPLAHPVEQGTFNPKVQGSRPWRPTPVGRSGAGPAVPRSAPAARPRPAAAGSPALKATLPGGRTGSVEPMFWSESPAGRQGPDSGPPGHGPVVEDRAARAGGPDPVAADEEFLAAVAAEFDAVQAALVRLDDGSFDRCQTCGGRISQEQLVADPLTTRCPLHA